MVELPPLTEWAQLMADAVLHKARAHKPQIRAMPQIQVENRWVNGREEIGGFLPLKKIRILSKSTISAMCATFERRSMDAFLGLVHDNVGNTSELNALWRLFDQVLSIIHSFGDATGQIALQGGLSSARFLPVLTHHAGMKISQLDYAEGRFYREALAHLRAVHSPGYRSKREEKRVNDMDRIVRTWNSIFGAARRILRICGWRDPLTPCLQVIPGSQTQRDTQRAVRSLRLVH